MIYDPIADSKEAEYLYGISFILKTSIVKVDAVIVAVSHNEFLSYKVADLDVFFTEETKKVVIDVKSILNRSEFEQAGYCYWSL